MKNKTMESIKKIKIEDIKLSSNKEIIMIKTSASNQFVFSFKLKDIKDKNDFCNKLRNVVNKTLQLNKENPSRELEYKDLKELEGSEI